MGGGTGRGWGGVIALALATAALSVVHPALLIFVPLALLLVALPPWRPQFVLLGAAMALLLTLRSGSDPLWYAERGWVLLLGAWFVVAVVVWPRAAFLSRGIAAVAAATATAVLLLLASRGGWSRLDWTVARKLRGGAGDALTAWAHGLRMESLADRMSQAVYRAAELQAMLYPALLALASLAALGVAWWAYRRFAEHDAAPLRPLREFRFRDELVWLAIAGALLIVLPLGEAAVRAGSNVLTFMGALYALRGLAVMLALVGMPGPAGVLIGGVAVLLLYPVVVVATIVVGLTDTWLDLRARRAAAGPES